MSTINAMREADEYIVADVLSNMGFGPTDIIQSQLHELDDSVLAGVIKRCEDEEIEYPEEFDADLADFIYEVEREIRSGLDAYLIELEKYYG